MTPRTLYRSSRAFSPNGLRAVCLAHDETGARHLETWELTGTGPRRRLRTPLGKDLPLTQCVALDDGRALLSWHEPGGAQRIDLYDRTGARRPLGPCPAPLRLLPGLDLPGWIATAITYGPDEHSTVYRVGDDEPWLTPVTRLPGRLGGAAPVGSFLAVTAVVDGTPTPLRIDPDRVTPLTPDGTGARHVLSSRAGRVLLAADTGAGLRLAVASDSGVRLLDGPGTPDTTVTPLALDPTGDLVAVAVNRGAGAELALYDGESGVLRQVTAPPGVLGPEAAWTHRGLWLAYSGPDRPTVFGWAPPGADALRTAPAQTGRHPARLERLPGAEGPVEAVVYGPDWRDGTPLVIALHGGPDRHWTLGFDPLLQTFADAGIAVIAPNQRGSTGYGRAHADAIRGAWGGPDLADLRALRAHVDETRGPHAPRPAVHGSSYGAFLALLATAADPDGWSGCVAVAPFTSVPALYADAPTPTRNLIDRLVGHGDVDDALGPRDLLRLAPRIRTGVLLLHGRLDETIPVSQSRALAHRLIDAGHGHVTYREPADRGHAALNTLPGTAQPREITDFLTRPDPLRGASTGQGHRPLLAAVAHH
ncbi:prolyl oligopeptidase family serine peptidase [Streptomyces sp. 4F14]|uniref:prolyl oligopeptidase family serine peptidase n=1 Tax=Streptomyces sp. 4F14 TaxID=3394380 RepID=UPI003A83DB71